MRQKREVLTRIFLFYVREIYTHYYEKNRTQKLRKTYIILEELIMTNKTYEIRNNNEMRYVAPDGTIFTSREDYLDYMKGLRN